MSMVDNKLLTVSVAAYNAEKYLKEVLDSFVGLQQIEDIEVFVIDDGGTDTSLEIAKNYQEKFPGVFYAVHKENGGWGSTVNYSIQHANGKYFRILDGDDYYDTTELSNFIEYLKECEAEIIISSFTSFNEDNNKVLETFSPDSTYKKGIQYNIEDVKEKFPLSMHAFTVSTALLKNNNICLKEHCPYRDMEFTAKVISLATTIQFFDSSIYYYRLGREGQSVSKESYLKHIDEHADIVCTILDISKSVESENKKRILYELANGACVQQYIIYFYSNTSGNIKNKLTIFDAAVSKYPEFCKGLKLPRHIELSRKHKFKDYNIIMGLLNIKRKIRNSQ